MIGRIRRLIALCVGVLCLVVTLGQVRVDLSGARGSAGASGPEGGGAPTLVAPPPGE